MRLHLAVGADSTWQLSQANLPTTGSLACAAPTKRPSERDAIRIPSAGLKSLLMLKDKGTPDVVEIKLSRH